MSAWSWPGPRVGPRVAPRVAARFGSRFAFRFAPPRLLPGGGRLIRSASVRLASAYGLVFGLSAVALVLVLWWASAGLLDRQVEAAIRADAQGLSERWGEGGLPALILTIQDRLTENVDDDAIYLLVDQDRHRVTGNLESWPHGVAVAGAWYELGLGRAGGGELAPVEGVGRAGGVRPPRRAPGGGGAPPPRPCSALTCRAASACWSAAMRAPACSCATC